LGKAVQSAPVHLLSVGAFGQSIGRYLADLYPRVEESIMTGDTLPSFRTVSGASVHVLATGRPVPRLCEMMDDSCRESGLPFFPLVLDSSVIRLGPVFVRGQGGCWKCWVRRSAQHAEWAKERSALVQYYSSNAGAGPRGYLEPFAMIAASQIAQTVRVLESSSEIAGYIWQMDLLTRLISTSRLVGIHDCPRCGLHRPAPMRSVQEMKDALGHLWIGKPGEPG